MDSMTKSESIYEIRRRLKLFDELLNREHEPAQAVAIKDVINRELVFIEYFLQEVEGITSPQPLRQHLQQIQGAANAFQRELRVRIGRDEYRQKIEPDPAFEVTPSLEAIEAMGPNVIPLQSITDGWRFERLQRRPDGLFDATLSKDAQSLGGTGETPNAAVTSPIGAIEIHPSPLSA